MTVAAPSGSPARPRALPAAPAPASAGRRRKGAAISTPARYKRLMALLVVLSLAWGGFGAWAVAEHSSSANSLAHADEPYTQDAQKLYLAIADADVTITTSFLRQAQPVPAGQQPYQTLADQQHFSADLANASQYLAHLKDSSGSPQFTSTFADVTAGLAHYQGDVDIALTEYGAGTTPTGNSYMQVASEDVHQVLLPDSERLYQLENDAVVSSSSQATSLPTFLVAIILAVATLVALLWAQREVARRTRRVFNLGLVVATAALVISGCWMAVSFGIARSDLDAAIGQGASPAESLAQASIYIQQIRGDSILNVIARSGNTSLQSNSDKLVAKVGPGAGSLLAQAQADGNAGAAPYISAVLRAAPAWYKVNAQGYTYGGHLQYGSEQNSVLNTAKPGFDQVKGAITGAIDAAQATFTTQADAGAAAFGPLEAVVIVASLLMAAACAWGLSRRLAEYR